MRSKNEQNNAFKSK